MPLEYERGEASRFPLRARRLPFCTKKRSSQIDTARASGRGKEVQEVIPRATRDSRLCKRDWHRQSVASEISCERDRLKIHGRFNKRAERCAKMAFAHVSKYGSTLANVRFYFGLATRRLGYVPLSFNPISILENICGISIILRSDRGKILHPHTRDISPQTSPERPRLSFPDRTYCRGR